MFHVFRDKFIHFILYASNYFYITNCGLHNWDEVMRISSHTKNRDVLWLQIMNLLLDFHNKRKEDTWCRVNPFLHYKTKEQVKFQLLMLILLQVKLWNDRIFWRCCFWFMRKSYWCQLQYMYPYIIFDIHINQVFVLINTIKLNWWIVWRILIQVKLQQ